MNILVDEELITEQICGNNFSYILSKESLFSNTDYKILQSNENGTFVKTMKMSFNGKIQMFYLTDGLKNFSSLLPQLDPEHFIVLVSNIFNSVLEVKNNGFLRISNIDISLEHIYINPLTDKAYILYLPTTTGFYNNDAVFENDLRALFAKLILTSNALASSKTMRLFSNLQNSSISLEHVTDNLVSSSNHDLSRDEEISRPNKGTLHLVSMNAPERIVLNVEQFPYVIGRSEKHANGVIKDNKMIGRAHCKVSQSEGLFFLEDLDSANGTSINRVKLTPGIVNQINNGDIVRMANYDFKVLIK